MLINFRQGIVQQQTSGGNPNFLAINGSGVDLLASFNFPTVIDFAQGDTDILFIEQNTVTQAWQSVAATCWLYWDINQGTGIRTFGFTLLAPVAQATQPVNPQNDQHWYDTVNFVMNVFNNGSWTVRVRLFAGQMNGGTLIQYPVGTQIGNFTTVRAGYILFDDNNNPVKKYQVFNLGEFITTESPLASQSGKLQNFALETAINTGTAIQAIAQYKLVCLAGPSQLGIASSNVPTAPAIGVAAQNFNSGDVNSYIANGYISNPLWTYGPVNANVFCDAFGNLTTTPPSVGSIQVVGLVVNPTTIFINIQPVIIFE